MRLKKLTILILSAILLVSAAPVTSFAANGDKKTEASQEDAKKKEEEEKKAAEKKAAEEKKKKEEADKAAAKTVIDTIAKIPAIDQLAYEHEEAIANARSLYNGLTDEQKKLVENEEKLKNSEKRITDMHEADQSSAKVVEDLIAMLPEKTAVMLDSESVIANTRKAYDVLTEVQKGLVPNVERLTDAETRLAELLEELTKEQVYSFDIPVDRSSISIFLRFTTDADRDGTGDEPAITLIEPKMVAEITDEEVSGTSAVSASSAEEKKDEQTAEKKDEDTTSASSATSGSAEVTAESAVSTTEEEEADPAFDFSDTTHFRILRPAIAYQDDAMTCNITWADEYVKLDFPRINAGTWRIHTSFPVLFSKTEYIGEAEGSEVVVTEPTEAPTEEPETPVAKKSLLSSLLPLILLLAAAFGGLFVFWKFFLKAPSKKQTAKPAPISDEDEIKQIKEELSAQIEADEEDAGNEENIQSGDVDEDADLTFDETIEEIIEDEDMEVRIQQLKDRVRKEDIE